MIRQRWAVYEEETRPVLDFYKPEIISEVDAIGSPAGVLGEVLNYVVPIQDAKFAEFDGA